MAWKFKGYTDENGEWHEPMTRAEARASVEEMRKFVEFMETGKITPRRPSSGRRKRQEKNR